MVVWLAFATAVVALVLALRGSSGLKGKVERLESDLRFRESQISGLREELEGQMTALRLHLSQTVEGRAPSAQMIREGRLYEDIDAAEAHRLVTEEEGTVIVDVRSPDEYAGGHVPGALHIPLDQIERRWSEVPKEASRVVVHCAMGGRSASACEFLSSQKGYLNLRNVAGPLVGSWPGELERGSGGG